MVVLSEDMAATLRARPRSEEMPIRVLNNFSLPSDAPIPGELPFSLNPDKLIILFAGNIGRFQGLDIVIDAMVLLKQRDDIEFILMGEGVAKPGLEKKVRSNGANVRFVGHQPIEVAKASMRQVDAGFVSLVPGMYQYAYPSKTMTYLEQGCPLIVAVEPESELAKETAAQGFGCCVPVGDSGALSELLTRLADDRTGIAEMHKAAFAKFQSSFSESAVLAEWSKILSEGSASDEVPRLESE